MGFLFAGKGFEKGFSFTHSLKVISEGAGSWGGWDMGWVGWWIEVGEVSGAGVLRAAVHTQILFVITPLSLVNPDLRASDDIQVSELSLSVRPCYSPPNIVFQHFHPRDAGWSSGKEWRLLPLGLAWPLSSWGC